MQSSFYVRYSRSGGKFCSFATVNVSLITRTTLHNREKLQEETLENSPPITRIVLHSRETLQEETLVNDDEWSNFSQEESVQTLAWVNCIQ
jgi:hypothetical protein